MFDYFGILVSIILGLALTHLLRGIARQLVHRGAVRTYWVHQLWTLNVILNVLAVWWGMYWWKGMEVWPSWWFFYLSFYAMIIFLWSAVLYPPETSENFDFDAYFYRVRRRFFGLATLAMLTDIPETMGKDWWHVRPMPVVYPFLISAMLLIGVIGFLTARRRVHAALGIAWFLLVMGYEFLTSLARIVGHHG